MGFVVDFFLKLTAFPYSVVSQPASADGYCTAVHGQLLLPSPARCPLGCVFSLVSLGWLKYLYRCAVSRVSWQKAIFPFQSYSIRLVNWSAPLGPSKCEMVVKRVGYREKGGRNVPRFHVILYCFILNMHMASIHCFSSLPTPSPFPRCLLSLPVNVYWVLGLFAGEVKLFNKDTQNKDIQIVAICVFYLKYYLCSASLCGNICDILWFPLCYNRLSITESKFNKGMYINIVA